MDEYEVLFKWVSTIGFPIICCVWMATVGRKSIDRLAESNEKLAEAIKKLGDATDRNSTLIERIETKIDRIEDKLEHHAEMFVEFKAKIEHDITKEGLVK